MEQLFSHNRIKTHLTAVLALLIEREHLGYFFSDRTAFANKAADLATEPDGTFVSYAAITTGRLRLVKGKTLGYVELEGTPDMVLEVISKKSVTKDTKILRRLYWQAGVPEYWLIDARKDVVQFDILRWTERGYITTRRHEGWLKSKVFGRFFQLETKPDPLGHPKFFLHIREAEPS
jgi:Uma2 family endonuclease